MRILSSHSRLVVHLVRSFREWSRRPCRPLIWVAIASSGLSAPTVAQERSDQGPSATSAVAITHVTVIDVERAARRADRTVVVRGNRIVREGPSAVTRIPSGARVVEGSGKYLIPGLWDMHTHVIDPDTPGPPDRILPLFIAAGVTGVRDMGSSSLDTILALRAEVRAGHRVGPRLIIAGKIIDGAPMVFPPDAILARTVSEGRHAVDSLADRGVDLIKAYEMLRPEVFRAVLSQARRRHLAVAGHIPLTIDAGEASDAGMRSFEHLRNLDFACSSRADSLRIARIGMLAAATGYAGRASSSTAAWSVGYGAGEKVRGDIQTSQRPRALETEDPKRCAALLARLARNHTWQTPTLFLQSHSLRAPDTVASVRADLRYVVPETRDRWARSAAAATALPPERRAAGRRWQTWEARLVKRLRDAGVALLAGTDESNPYVVPGFGLHEELELLVNLGGLTPAEALRAATLEPARFLDMTNSLGTVAAGKFADLVLLAADPLADIRNTRRVDAVVANGRLFGRAVLDSLLAGAEQ